MNSEIIKGINKYVKKEDTLYFLGDWSFGGIESIWECYNKINCKNIIFILGNHDEHINKNHILPNCKREEPYSQSIISGIPIGKEYPDYVESQLLFKKVIPYLEVKINKTNFILCHFPIEEWNDRYGKSIHLHGHQHGKNRIIKNRLDVGIDNAFKIFKEYKPFSEEEIYEIIQKQNRFL
jgi:calcineurin-like phosphoesterase family protein